ncbi:MAG: hypothetical protein AAGM22_24105 [Acidobacteriota bacterium]
MTEAPEHVSPAAPERGPEILRADPKHQRWVLLALALIASLAVWSLLQLVHQLDAARVISIKSVRTAAEQTIAVAGTYFRLVAGGLLILGSYLLWTAVRIVRSGQFPPPGTWVVRDTVVRRGGRAKVRATVAGVIGVGLLGFGLLFPGWAEEQVVQLLSAALQTPDTPPDAYLPQIE